MPAKPANPTAKTARVRRVVFLGYDGVTLLDLAGPMQVFEAANSLRRKAGFQTPYDVVLASRDGGAIRTDVGVPMGAAASFTAQGWDLVVVPGGPGVWDVQVQSDVRAFLTRQDGETPEIASVCLGAFLLGHSGLLAGRKATTHWRYCARLQADFPDALVQEDAIFTQDGVWTSAGVTAGIDLALALVERDFGHSLAVDVARGLVVFLKRSGGQSQYSRLLEAQTNVIDTRLSDLHAWMLDNIHRAMPVEVLAERMGMSVRNFARFYVELTGVTPRRAVENLRVDTAQRMLLDSPRLAIKRIAERCGFSDEEQMRRSFARHSGLSPSDYRQRFSSLNGGAADVVATHGDAQATSDPGANIEVAERNDVD